MAASNIAWKLHLSLSVMFSWQVTNTACETQAASKLVGKLPWTSIRSRFHQDTYGFLYISQKTFTPVNEKEKGS